MKKIIATLALIFAASSASADYTMIVPQKVGGGTSVWAEIVAKELEKHLGEPIVIDYRPGARVLGVIMKKFKFSRPALLIGFILASRVEGLSLQLFSIYTIEKLSTRPIFLGLIAITIALFVWGITRKSEMEFS